MQYEEFAAGGPTFEAALLAGNIEAYMLAYLTGFFVQWPEDPFEMLFELERAEDIARREMVCIFSFHHQNLVLLPGSPGNLGDVCHGPGVQMESGTHPRWRRW